MRRVAFWTLIVALAAVWAVAASAQSGDETRRPVSDEVALQALSEAIRFAEATYETDEGETQGVAYAWGGRMSVDAFLDAVASGKRPGAEAGVDASGIVVQAYLAADPSLSFVTEWGGERRSVKDATSATLYRFNIEPVPVDAMRPGDLIFFRGEAGEVSGVAVFERRVGPNVHFIVASAGQGRVVRTFLNVNNDYWTNRFLGAGRLLENAR